MNASFVHYDALSTQWRAHQIRLTGKAREIGPEVEAAYNQLYAFAMQGISQEELDGFVNQFGRMAENLMSAFDEKRR